MRWITDLSARWRAAVSAGAVAGMAVLVAGVAALPPSGADDQDHRATPRAEVAAAPTAFPPVTATAPTTTPPVSPARSVPTTAPRAALPAAGESTDHDAEAGFGEYVDIRQCGEADQDGDCCEFNEDHDGECLEYGDWVEYGGSCGCGENPPYDETTMALAPLPDGRHAVILIRADLTGGRVQLDQLDVQSAADGTV